MEEAEQKQKSKLSPIFALVSVVAIFLGAQIAAVNLMAFFGLLFGIKQDELADWLSSSVAVQAVTLLVIAGIGLIAVHWLLRWVRESWAGIGLRKPQLLDVGRALIGYGWYLLFFIGAMVLVGQLVPGIDVDQQQQLGFDRQTTDGFALFLIGLSLVLLPAFYEEVLMRGVLYTGMRSRLSFGLTALVVSVIFGLAHLEWGSGAALNWAAAIDTGILALVLVYLRETTKSLWPAIFLHGLKNLVAFTLVFVLKVG